MKKLKEIIKAGLKDMGNATARFFNEKGPDALKGTSVYKGIASLGCGCVRYDSD